MKIVIDTEKLWDFVRDAYEEGKEDGNRESLKHPRMWDASDAREQVRAFIAASPIDWAEAREMLED